MMKYFLAIVLLLSSCKIRENIEKEYYVKIIDANEFNGITKSYSDINLFDNEVKHLENGIVFYKLGQGRSKIFSYTYGNNFLKDIVGLKKINC